MLCLLFPKEKLFPPWFPISISSDVHSVTHQISQDFFSCKYQNPNSNWLKQKSNSWSHEAHRKPWEKPCFQSYLQHSSLHNLDKTLKSPIMGVIVVLLWIWNELTFWSTLNSAWCTANTQYINYDYYKLLSRNHHKIWRTNKNIHSGYIVV